MAKKKRENRFAGRTSRSMEKPVSNFGYLKLPDDIKMFKPEGGTEVVFDILPYKVTDPDHMDNKRYDTDGVEGDYWWKRPIRVHRDVGPESAVIICPTTFGKPCPICEYGSRRRKEGADWKDELSGIFPKNRTIFLINMIDSSDLELDYDEGEIYVMDQSDKNFLETLNEEVKRDIDNQGFPDHEMGLSIKTYFKAKKIGKVSYGEASRIDFEERDQQYDDEYLEDLPSLDDICKVMSYEEIEALYFGMEGLDDDPEGDPVVERKSRRSREKPASRRTRKPREETDEVETIDDNPEPEEEKKPRRTRKPAAEAEEKPKRTRKPRTTKPKEEPEPEPEAEESEEKPKRTRKPRAAAKDKCPHGHRFGVDTDTQDACDTCKIWDDCMDEKEGE